MEFEVEVGVFEAPRKANPFDGVVAQVLSLPVDEGQLPKGTVTIPVEMALTTAQAKIREAAREVGAKARIRQLDEEARKITFTLNVKPVKDSADEADETSPVEGEDEAPKPAKKG